jgi:hypothetical protein
MKIRFFDESTLGRVCTQHKANGINKSSLARVIFANQNVQARIEVELEIIEQSEVFYCDLL